MEETPDELGRHRDWGELHRRRDALIAEIEEVFADVPLDPKDEWALQDAEAADMHLPAGEHDPAKRLLHWREVDLAIEDPNGYGPCYVSDTAFRHYLPAYLVRALRMEQCLGGPGDPTRASEAIELSLCVMPEWPSNRRRWGLLTWRERRTVARFLELLSDASGEIDRNMIEEGLDGYWRTYLDLDAHTEWRRRGALLIPMIDRVFGGRGRATGISEESGCFEGEGADALAAPRSVFGATRGSGLDAERVLELLPECMRWMARPEEPGDSETAVAFQGVTPREVLQGLAEQALRVGMMLTDEQRVAVYSFLVWARERGAYIREAEAVLERWWA